jgi:hypothetical protein
MSSADHFVILYGPSRVIPVIVPSWFVLWDVSGVLLGESPQPFAAAARLTRDDNPNRRPGDVFGTHHRAAHLEDFKNSMQVFKMCS